jgi:hypothetical protein
LRGGKGFSSPCSKILRISGTKGSGGEDMDNRFQGLVVFLIGLLTLLVAYTISEAETTVTIGINTRAIFDLSSPTIILWVFGAILVIAGIIWAAVGDKLEVSVQWK